MREIYLVVQEHTGWDEKLAAFQTTELAEEYRQWVASFAPFPDTALMYLRIDPVPFITEVGDELSMIIDALRMFQRWDESEGLHEEIDSLCERVNFATKLDTEAIDGIIELLVTDKSNDWTDEAMVLQKVLDPR